MTSTVIPTPLDKFKLIETAPIYAVAPTGAYSTGSYSSASFKNVYNLKFKDPKTLNTVKPSGIISQNAPIVFAPTGPSSP